MKASWPRRLAALQTRWMTTSKNPLEGQQAHSKTVQQKQWTMPPRLHDCRDREWRAVAFGFLLGIGALLRVVDAFGRAARGTGFARLPPFQGATLLCYEGTDANSNRTGART